MNAEEDGEGYEAENKEYWKEADCGTSPEKRKREGETEAKEVGEGTSGVGNSRNSDGLIERLLSCVEMSGGHKLGLTDWVCSKNQRRIENL